MGTDNKPLISIIIPVYNISKYIEKCLYSVINQTYINIECIIINDCTPDDSIQKCNKITENYSGHIQFQIINHNYNRGLSAARNTGVDAAHGDWLFFLDGDDEIPDNAIELLLCEALNHPKADIIVGNMYSEPHDDYYELKADYYPFRIDNNHKIRNCFFCNHSIIPVMACNKIIKKNFFLQNNLYFKEGLIHEDELWIFDVVNHANSISLIDNYTYLRFKRPNSITTTSSQQNSANHMAKIILEILHKIKPPCDEMQTLFYLRYYFFNYPYIRHTKEFYRIFLLFLKALIKYRHYKTALHFLLHCFSNSTVFNLKYNTIPKLLQNASDKDKQSTGQQSI